MEYAPAPGPPPDASDETLACSKVPVAVFVVPSLLLCVLLCNAIWSARRPRRTSRASQTDPPVLTVVLQPNGYVLAERSD